MNRRRFLAGLTATAAGLLVPERKVWALDRAMIPGTNYYLVDRYVDPSEWYDIRAMGQNADGSTWFDAGVTGYRKIPVHGWTIDEYERAMDEWWAGEIKRLDEGCLYHVDIVNGHGERRVLEQPIPVGRGKF